LTETIRLFRKQWNEFADGSSPCFAETCKKILGKVKEGPEQMNQMAIKHL